MPAAHDDRARAVATWDRHAARYARQVRFELRAARVAADLAAPTAADRVLDVATGSGVMLDVLRERPDPPRSVVAIDSSPAMLALIKPLPQGWSAQRADARALPLATGCVDVVTVGYVLQLLDADDRASVLGEVRRVLTPGGRVVTITPHVPRRGTQRFAASVLDGLAALAPDRLGGLRTLDPRADLATAGFCVERARHVHHGYPSLVVLARCSPSSTELH